MLVKVHRPPQKAMLFRTQVRPFPDAEVWAVHVLKFASIPNTTREYSLFYRRRRLMFRPSCYRPASRAPSKTAGHLIPFKPLPRIYRPRFSSTMAATRLHGRAFYESIGSPKVVVAPMVDQSEFAWRLLTRSFLPPDLRRSILAYSPMLHAKVFADTTKYRNDHFKPLKPPAELPSPTDKTRQAASVSDGAAFLDGNPEIDRPLFVQFCANDPDVFLNAARIVQPYCDAVDLNLGCPQGIAKRGHYGAFLQEDWDTIHRLISNLHKNLDVPVTAKFRILETKEKTLEYARMLLNAGASIITVHGRLREQKGHNTGLADWSAIKYLRDNLPKETVIFANGNVLQHGDIQKCIDATGVDGVMSAEGNLYDPSILAPAPKTGEHERDFWRGKNGEEGWRMDAVLRRYLDIIYEHVLRQTPPQRSPLFLPTDQSDIYAEPEDVTEEGPPPTKKQKRLEAAQTPKAKPERITDANLIAMQAHLFHFLRALVAKHTNVRDQLAHTRNGDMEGFEKVLDLVEAAVRRGLLDYEADPARFSADTNPDHCDAAATAEVGDDVSSLAAIRRCKRPYFVCQPYVRPSPKEALAKGSMQLSKKKKARLELEEKQQARLAKTAGAALEGTTGVVKDKTSADPPTLNGKKRKPSVLAEVVEEVEVPKQGLVCG